MRTGNILAGMQLLLPYYAKPDGFHASAEHDVFYMHATSLPLAAEDLAKLIELGWHQEYDGRDYGKEFAAEDYRADESWVAYV